MIEKIFSTILEFFPSVGMIILSVAIILLTLANGNRHQSLKDDIKRLEHYQLTMDDELSQMKLLEMDFKQCLNQIEEEK